MLPPCVTFLSPVRGQLAVLQVPATAKALTFFLRLLLAIASGVALTLAYPRWNLSLMVWLWIFPLLYALWSGRAKSEVRSQKSEVRRSFVLGYAGGARVLHPQYRVGPSFVARHLGCGGQFMGRNGAGNHGRRRGARVGAVSCAVLWSVGRLCGHHRPAAHQWRWHARRR